MKVEVAVLGSLSLIVRRVSGRQATPKKVEDCANCRRHDYESRVCVQVSASLSIQLDPLWFLRANTGTEFASLTEPHFRSRAAMER